MFTKALNLKWTFLPDIQFATPSYIYIILCLEISQEALSNTLGLKWTSKIIAGVILCNLAILGNTKGSLGSKINFATRSSICFLHAHHQGIQCTWKYHRKFTELMTSTLIYIEEAASSVCQFVLVYILLESWSMATEVVSGGYTPPQPASPEVEAITVLVSQVLRLHISICLYAYLLNY